MKCSDIFQIGKGKKTPLDENDYVESLAEKCSSMQSKVECLQTGVFEVELQAE